MTYTTPTGIERPSPWFRIQASSAELMLRLLAEFGMTPSSRTRVRGGGPPENPDAVESLRILGRRREIGRLRGPRNGFLGVGKGSVSLSLLPSVYIVRQWAYFKDILIVSRWFNHLAQATGNFDANFTGQLNQNSPAR